MPTVVVAGRAIQMTIVRLHRFRLYLEIVRLGSTTAAQIHAYLAGASMQTVPITVRVTTVLQAAPAMWTSMNVHLCRASLIRRAQIPRLQQAVFQLGYLTALAWVATLDLTVLRTWMNAHRIHARMVLYV
jgi:hypothetical protein